MKIVQRVTEVIRLRIVRVNDMCEVVASGMKNKTKEALYVFCGFDGCFKWAT